jgi:hypothetical protein
MADPAAAPGEEWAIAGTVATLKHEASWVDTASAQRPQETDTAQATVLYSLGGQELAATVALPPADLRRLRPGRRVTITFHADEAAGA